MRAIFLDAIVAIISDAAGVGLKSFEQFKRIINTIHISAFLRAALEVLQVQVLDLAKG